MNDPEIEKMLKEYRGYLAKEVALRDQINMAMYDQWLANPDRLGKDPTTEDLGSEMSVGQFLAECASMPAHTQVLLAITSQGRTSLKFLETVEKVDIGVILWPWHDGPCDDFLAK